MDRCKGIRKQNRRNRNENARTAERKSSDPLRFLFGSSVCYPPFAKTRRFTAQTIARWRKRLAMCKMNNSRRRYSNMAGTWRPYSGRSKIRLRILGAGFEESLHIPAERISDRYYLIYRCQCEVARACLRGIRSFAHALLFFR